MNAFHASKTDAQELPKKSQKEIKFSEQSGRRILAHNDRPVNHYLYTTTGSLMRMLNPVNTQSSVHNPVGTVRHNPADISQKSAI